MQRKTTGETKDEVKIIQQIHFRFVRVQSGLVLVNYHKHFSAYFLEESLKHIGKEKEGIGQLKCKQAQYQSISSI